MLQFSVSIVSSLPVLLHLSAVSYSEGLRCPAVIKLICSRAAAVIADCTAATDPSNHAAAIKIVTMQGGVFGAVADSAAVLAELEKFGPKNQSLPNGLNGLAAADEARAARGESLRL